MESVFSNQIIGVTGNNPYEERAIERIVTLEGGGIHGMESWQDGQIIVIGKDDFDEEYLNESIRIWLDHNLRFRYLSQEAFWAYWLDGVETFYYEGDPRIDEHEGLSYLASVGFKWPSIAEIQGSGTLDNTIAACNCV